MTRFLQVFLYPFSLCYGIIVHIRNLLFDFNILPAKQFPIPVISIGNLSVGGTGKTPHTEYLIRLLSSSFKVATLSRGYGRSTRGFIIATENQRSSDIGDEPMQLFHKFNNIIVSVDEKRTRGIRNLLEIQHPPEVILLDDAFQHRYVKPGLSILLTDYHRIYCEDYMLPSGTLREFRSGAERADIIIVTKTPKIFSPITRRRIMEELHPTVNQLTLFSYIKYSTPYSVFNQDELQFPVKVNSILLFTGIASDYPLIEHLERLCSDLVVEKFRDHHSYSKQDIEKIICRYNDLPTQKKILITTEKDVMRLKYGAFTDYFKNLPLFCIPMEIEFHGADKEQFDDAIIKYVRQNKRDSRIS